MSSYDHRGRPHPTLFAAVEQTERDTGMARVPFFDGGWRLGPGGHVDLFEAFHAMTGLSLHPLVIYTKLPCQKFVDIRLVQMSKLVELVNFLPAFKLSTPFPGLIRPDVLRPGERLLEDFREIFGLCYRISARTETPIAAPSSLN